MDDGQWHHIAASYDGTTFYVYADGELDASEPSTGQITLSSYPLYIGNNSQNTDREWNGLIDDVMIYNRALSQEEIQILMQSSGSAYPKASSPVPTDGAIYTDTWATLTWRAGDFAVSHDAYFGDNFDDVN
ncbi:MAG: LamG domain-containing protein, partial [Planctomycetota bacterium]